MPVGAGTGAAPGCGGGYVDVDVGGGGGAVVVVAAGGCSGGAVSGLTVLGVMPCAVCALIGLDEKIGMGGMLSELQISVVCGSCRDVETLPSFVVALLAQYR
jgi:hypothetical protein